jgi:phage shock protein PspC (stress-responsive transcriptional regulator)
MNKTININLAGIIFHLDEQAYENFKSYLMQVKDALLNQEGGSEIIADIEARIAEIFAMRKAETGKDVITVSDVDFVISTLGRPEDFADEDETETTGTNHFKTSRRLFRNPDEKVIGGVSSGIAAYFNTDPVLIRVIFLILLFFTGIGLMAYIILWIAIPEASTTAQKLQMRGEPVNLGNIEKSVKEELEGVKERFGRFRENQKNQGSVSNAIQRFLNFILSVLESIFRFVLKFLSIILIAIGSVIAFALIMLILGVVGTTWNLGGVDFVLVDGSIIGMSGAEALLGNGWRMVFMKVGTLLTLVLPIVGLLGLIVKLLGKNIPNSKILNISALMSFVAGLIMIIFSGISLGRDFTDSATEMERVELVGTNFDLRTDLLEDHDNFIFEVHDDQLRIENVRFNIKRTYDSTATLVLKHKARGRNNAAARSRAQSFNYPIETVGSTLTFSEYFSVPKESLFRNQELKATLMLPVGAEIFLDPSMENIIFDIDNVHDMLDDDMLGHTWTMTKAGLVCSDCEDQRYYQADDIVESVEEDLDELEDDIEQKLEELELELKKLRDR